MLVQLPTSNPIPFLSIKSSGQTTWYGLKCVHRGSTFLVCGLCEHRDYQGSLARLPPFLDKKKKRRL
jgi:uncharacterized ParB-like nuclease family protein